MSASDIDSGIHCMMPSYSVCKDIVQGLTAVAGGQQTVKEYSEIVFEKSFCKLLDHLDAFNEIAMVCNNSDWKEL